MDKPRLVDERMENALSVMCADLQVQAARALHCCGITTSQQLCEVPAITAHEMTKWVTGHESLVKAIPTLGVDLETLVKTVSVLKCRLRLGTDAVDDESPHHTPLPALPVTARARAEICVLRHLC